MGTETVIITFIGKAFLKVIECFCGKLLYVLRTKNVV